MRHIVSSWQVGHLWAHGAQPWAANSSRSVSFDGADFLSYRTVIATLLPDKTDGATVVLRTTERHSMTTSSKHEPIVRSVTRHLDSYTVPFCAHSDFVGEETARESHAANVAHFVRNYRDSLDKARRAISHPDWYLNNARDFAREAQEYARRFGAEVPQLDVERDVAEVETLQRAREERRNTPAAQRKRERARVRRAERKQEEEEKARAEAQAREEEYRAEFDRRTLAAFGTWGAVADYLAEYHAARGDDERDRYWEKYTTPRELERAVSSAHLRATSDARILSAFGAWDSVAGFLESVAQQPTDGTYVETLETRSLRAVDSYVRAREEEARNLERRAISDATLCAVFGSVAEAGEFLGDAQARRREEIAQLAHENGVAHTWQESARAEESAILGALRSASREVEYRETREAWRNGAAVHVPSDSGATMLRVVRGDTVQTSLGAEVPLPHASRLFRIVARVRAQGANWQPDPTHALRVGAFVVDSIGADGTLRAGCHVLTWEEINRFAKVQGWTVGEESREVAQ